MTRATNEVDRSCEDIIEMDEISPLPSWLKVKPEMLYHPDCIKKGKKLGQGQFGSVFKGHLVQGNAVYVK